MIVHSQVGISAIDDPNSSVQCSVVSGVLTVSVPSALKCHRLQPPMKLTSNTLLRPHPVILTINRHFS